MPRARRIARRIAALGPDRLVEDMRALPGIAERRGLGAWRNCVAAVDVGTGSARAGDLRRRGAADRAAPSAPIAMNAPLARPRRAGQRRDLGRRLRRAARRARPRPGRDPTAVAGISFDATCSLVVRDAAGAPVSVSTGGEDRWDTVVWLDHRAKAEAEECTATGHRVLDYVGGVMSPEMADAEADVAEAAPARRPGRGPG